MKKILFAFGTRPEAIKMAPLILLMKKERIFNVIVCVTAQHRQMLDQVLQLFEIIPDYDLDIMKPGQDLCHLASKVLIGAKDVLSKEKPDLILVHGDTTTTLAFSLAAFYSKIPLGHVEAGLRTFNLSAPWPEEANRQITDVLATYYFCPTQANANNLNSVTYKPKKIIITGNTVIDALLKALHLIENNPDKKQQLIQFYASLNLKIPNEKRIVLITGHRRENFGEGFLSICQAIKELATKYAESVEFIYPVHLNPNVQDPVHNLLSNTNNIHLLPPLDYEPFVFLMKQSYFIISDSGGIQEEAPGLGKPVLVLRDTTERPEAISAGTARLVGTNKESIVREASKLLDSSSEYNIMAKAHNPYGDGSASNIINDFIKTELL